MTSRELSFTPQPARVWTGRYNRIPGETTALHVRQLGRDWWPCVDWVADNEVAVCPMVDQVGARELGRAVNQGKRLVGEILGGSFLINEYGQVLVPSTTGERVAAVGEWSGPLEFTNKLSGNGTFDLASDRGLVPGAPWRLPYVGIPHNLSARSRIYLKVHDGAGMHYLEAPTQDARLINALRRVRPSGAVRFVVTYPGIVLTKVPVGPWTSERWEPRYIGRVDLHHWYQKEG